MNSLQVLERPGLLDAAARALRPYTRTSNALSDLIKPKLYHKVDRSVLDALVRRLEGFHQPWVALQIKEIAELAGVSNWSVTKALARLVEMKIVVRYKKKMTKAGRYIWNLALTERYRVVPGEGAPAEEASPSTAAPQKEPARAKLIEEAPQPAPPPSPAPVPAECAIPRDLPPMVQLELEEEAAPALEEEPEVAPKPSRGLLAPEQTQVVERLRKYSVDYWKAKKLVREHPLDLICQALDGLKHRVGTVRNPAAWIVREIERGGYAPPAGVVEEQQRAVRLQKERQEAAQRQAELDAVEQAAELQISHYLALPEAQQQILEDVVRGELRQISPRLAEAPWELYGPGPVRGKLLEVLGREGRTKLHDGAPAVIFENHSRR